MMGIWIASIAPPKAIRPRPRLSSPPPSRQEPQHARVDVAAVEGNVVQHLPRRLDVPGEVVLGRAERTSAVEVALPGPAGGVDLVAQAILLGLRAAHRGVARLLGSGRLRLLRAQGGRL